MKWNKLWMLAAILICGTMTILTSCKSKPTADLVVYGKIYTSDSSKVVEAFAVKDGKYVYVGDKAGAEAYVEEGKRQGSGDARLRQWSRPLFDGLCHSVCRHCHEQGDRCGPVY